MNIVKFTLQALGTAFLLLVMIAGYVPGAAEAIATMKSSTNTSVKWNGSVFIAVELANNQSKKEKAVTDLFNERYITFITTTLGIENSAEEIIEYINI